MSDHGEFCVATWNILRAEPRDKKVLPQLERWGSIVPILNAVQPDVIHLSEVELSKGNYIPDTIAASLHLDAYATIQHVNKSDGLLMAVKSLWTPPESSILDPELDGRAGIFTRLGKTAVIGVHSSHELSKSEEKVIQLTNALILGGTEQAIIMGDLNCLRFQQSRRLLKRLGFSSVLATLGPHFRPPITFPTPEYRFRTIRWYQHPAIPFGYSIDDIYYPKAFFELINAGLLHGETDHWGVYATFCPKGSSNIT